VVGKGKKSTSVCTPRESKNTRDGRIVVRGEIEKRAGTSVCPKGGGRGEGKKHRRGRRSRAKKEWTSPTIRKVSREGTKRRGTAGASSLQGGASKSSSNVVEIKHPPPKREKKT